jgi:hypothetical protein
MTESLLGEGQTTQHMTQQLTATGEKTEGHGHKLYMDSFFSFLKPVNELTKIKIICFGTVGLNIEGMPKDLRCKTVKLRWWDIRVRKRGDWTAIYWMDKRDISMLTFTIRHKKEISAMNRQHDKVTNCGRL